jgi:HSP20 family molecular chaperone IbpA
MKKAIVRLSVLYGEPKIGKLDVVDGFVELEILVPGLEANKINFVATEDRLTITVSASGYVNRFSIVVVSEYADYRGFEYFKRDGVLSVSIPLLDEVEDEINITI